jgi:hypothetical protein
VRARAKSASELKKASTSVYVIQREGRRSPDARSRLPPAPNDAQRAGAADPILEQLELHRIADLQAVERLALAHVSAMKVDLSSVGDTDESVPLTDQQPYDLAEAEHARRVGPLREAGMCLRAARRENVKVRAHVPTSAVPNDAVALPLRHATRRFRRVGVQRTASDSCVLL